MRERIPVDKQDPFEVVWILERVATKSAKRHGNFYGGLGFVEINMEKQDAYSNPALT